MSLAPPARFARAVRRLSALVAVLLSAFVLTACERIAPLERDTCIAVVPALELPGTAIRITAVSRLEGAPQSVAVDYLRRRSAEGLATPLPETGPHRIACHFRADQTSAGLTVLDGVRSEAGDLAPARLVFLRRFWLGDADARASGMAQVTITPGALGRGLVTLDAESGLRLQQFLDALAPAALYALMGLAFALVWGVVGRIVFFLGELAMLGAFVVPTVAVAIGEGAWNTAIVAVAAACGAAALAVALWGGAIGHAVFSRVAFRASRPVVIVGVGLAIALQEFVARTHGVRDLWVPPPAGAPLLVADGPFEVLVTSMRLVLVAVAFAAIAAVLVVFPRTAFGRAWRAVGDDPVMARLLGVDPARVLVATMALAGALCGLAGAVHTLAWGGISFHMGTALGVKAAIAALIGGLVSLPGAALGGVALGLVEAGWTAFRGADWRDAVVFALLAVGLVVGASGREGHDGRR